jgi:hypothetical protein
VGELAVIFQSVDAYNGTMLIIEFTDLMQNGNLEELASNFHTIISSNLFSCILGMEL